MNKNEELKVLLVDDDRATNVYHKHNLGKLGCNNIHSVLNGQQAIDYLLSKDETGKHPHPNIIFLDINMPIMNGWEFLRQYELLSKEQKGDHLVTIVTTSVNVNEIKRSKENPLVSTFVAKPLTIEKLEVIIEEFYHKVK